MVDKFQNKYRIASARLQGYDYGQNGAYFITICTKNGIHYFGEIADGKMILSQVGVIADLMWYEIKNHAKNIELTKFVVMPNHIHGIMILNDNGLPIVTNPTVETRHALSLQPQQPKKTIGQQRFQSQGKHTISSIVGSYKSAVTKHAHRLCYDFAWQTRFHDHIIRDDQSYANISNYIANNPANWATDKFHENE